MKRRKTPIKNPTSSIREMAQAVHKLVFLMDKFADQTLKKAGAMSFSRMRILMAVRHIRDPLSQKDIARFMGITEASVSRHIGEFVKKGLLTRGKSDRGKRMHDIALSPAGKKILEKTVAVLEETLQNTLKQIPEEEIEKVGKGASMIAHEIAQQTIKLNKIS